MHIKQPYCPDCGPAQTNHLVARINAASNLFISLPLEKATIGVSKKLPPWLFQFVFETIPAFLLRTSSKLHIGRMEKKPQKGDSDRARCLWEEAIRRGIVMEEFCIAGNTPGIFIASWNGESICFQDVPRPREPGSQSLAWMDNKKIMREHFATAGIPIATGGVARTGKDAQRLFGPLRKPLITKPHEGSRSRHTTIHIETLGAFKIGFEKAKKLSAWVIVEEELRGMVYRGSVIGGKTVAVICREPPHAIGDGRTTIRDLVAKENSRPERQGPIFHTIELGKEAEEELKRQGLSLQSIPEKGRFVSLNQKVGRGVGASMSDVTDDIHPDNRKLLEDAAAELNDPVVGIDFIIGDIKVSWKEQDRSGIIECNSLPFIDLHHYPLSGKPRNVAGAVWDI